jgi:hypothetical protein
VSGTLKTPDLAMGMTSGPVMEAIGVQVLIIDGVHNTLAGTYDEQRIGSRSRPCEASFESGALSPVGAETISHAVGGRQF